MTIICLISSHPDLVTERNLGGSVFRALKRNARLRTLVAAQKRGDNYEISGELLEHFTRVFQKTTQGVFYALYRKLLPVERITLTSIADRRLVTPEQMLNEIRPSPFRDITDEPLPEIREHGWVCTQPIFITEMQSLTGGDPVRRIFRLVRETPVEWVEYLPGAFRFAFVEKEGGGGVFIFDLWETLLASVATPWPGGRGPLRRGRRNRFSRERLQTPRAS